MCCLKKTYRKSQILHPSSVTFGCNRSRIQPGTGSSLISWKRPRKRFKQCAKLVGSPHGMSILHRWFIQHELKTCHVELTSFCCFLRSTSTEAYSQLEDLVPEIAASCKQLFLDASVHYFVCSGNGGDKVKYLADILVKFLMKLEREHSAPANDEILNEGVNWWLCGQPGSTPSEQCCPGTCQLWLWQSWLCRRWQTTRVVWEGGNSAW